MKFFYYSFIVFLFANTLFGYKHFILISAPGSGKGTFSQYCVKKYGYEQICAGDIFRNEIALKTELGIQIEPIVDRGEYIDETIVCQLMEQYVSDTLQKNKPFILDGFPRSIISFNFLGSLFKKYNIENDVCFLQFTANDELCVERILNRLICTNCFMVYSQIFNGINDINKCSNCQADLSRRKADTQEIAQKRIVFFHQDIEPVMDLVKQYYPVQTIQNEGSIDQLQEKYEELFNKK